MNGISTIKGGTHVDYITNQIANYVMTVVNKKNKNANVKAHNVKSYLWVFINALIDNPSFDSQTKETLTKRPNSFGSACELTPEFLKNGMYAVITNIIHILVYYFKCKILIIVNIATQWPRNLELWTAFSHGLISSKAKT